MLDVGCDDGYLMSRVDAPLHLGVDLSPRLRPSADLAVLRASATRLPALAASFDCILAFDVLEHIEDDRAVMREMLRVLAPHGTIWFSTPSSEFRMVPNFLTPYTNRGFGHVRHGYTPTTLRALLPDPQQWTVECRYWNEPLLRIGFGALHFVDLAAPSLAALVTRLCYRIDRRFPHGRRGHLLGTIRRKLEG